jgi:hypothetical protein
VVEVLVRQPGPDTQILSTDVRDAFASLVLQNPDCRRHFFDLFTPDTRALDPEEFRRLGCSVVWNRVRRKAGGSDVLLVGSHGARSITLRKYSEVNGILYGIRYWARDELNLVDEFYRDGRGSVMYPVVEGVGTDGPRDVVQDILSLIVDDKEWTVLSISQLIEYCCERRRRSLSRLFAAISWLYANHQGHIVLIPTSRSFATISARSRQREEFELRAYYRDSSGRYISHVRLHRAIGRELYAHKRKETWP